MNGNESNLQGKLDSDINVGEQTWVLKFLLFFLFFYILPIKSGDQATFLSINSSKMKRLAREEDVQKERGKQEMS